MATETTTRERVIGLWLDAEAGSESPKWIVSHDEWTWEGNECHSSTTVAIFDADDYDGARDAAFALATQEGRRVLKTNRYGQGKIIFDPAD